MLFESMVKQLLERVHWIHQNKFVVELIKEGDNVQSVILDSVFNPGMAQFDYDLSKRKLVLRKRMKRMRLIIFNFITDRDYSPWIDGCLQRTRWIFNRKIVVDVMKEISSNSTVTQVSHWKSTDADKNGKLESVGPLVWQEKPILHNCPDKARGDLPISWLQLQ